MARVVSGPEITGVVVSRQTGSPIGRATVTVSQTVYTDPDFTSGTTTLTCDGSGVFFCYAGNGTYTFTTTAQGAAPIESVTVRGTGGGGSGSGASLVETVNSVATAGAAQTIPDPSVSGTATMNRLVLSAATCTLTFPTPVAGASFTLILVQDATGGRLVTWPGSVNWGGAGTPVLSTAATKEDWFVFSSATGSQWKGFLSGQGF